MIIRRKRCDFCQGFIEGNIGSHKCSERRLRAIERKNVIKAKQELQDLLNPIRTISDKLEDVAIMLSYKYVDFDREGLV